MLLATSNKAKRLLCLSYIGQVRSAELVREMEGIQSLLAELPPGFRLLVDLSGLDSMEQDCVAEIGRVMELLDKGGVGLVVRVIPNPAKDIGLNILAIFHYPHRPRTVTCESMTEAGRRLAL
jgi:hypothetical protein